MIVIPCPGGQRLMTRSKTSRVLTHPRNTWNEQEIQQSHDHGQFETAKIPGWLRKAVHRIGGVSAIDPPACDRVYVNVIIY
jgi:hypothetical protein